MTKEMISYAEISKSLDKYSSFVLGNIVDAIFEEVDEVVLPPKNGKSKSFSLECFGGAKALKPHVNFSEGEEKSKYNPVPEEMSKELFLKLIESDLIALREGINILPQEESPLQESEPSAMAWTNPPEPLETAR